MQEEEKRQIKPEEEKEAAFGEKKGRNRQINIYI